ncbi:hypothetical protein PF005_g19400 [Phytophthora fragariae]|uniref:Uncharacterized protein n=1 Tax=Phytophthora fragariae TaxID=53985 RepID=A0A6A3FKA1_9STRA|nr:hypothetical protein PF009_g8021 [Phytophthora fragariae]KAE9089073.1 hypothetical protein PF007_g19729 [Phytophthora fragariae]KAE9149063.1 hypothetical protein PF006_g6400 [Phytophthora fragariae]KAE9190067.1 hypothetical protein PF005_g19400 [Phytophthora fragariae]KAE9242333.1 hypothetical protein PF002_g8786 [Phytophthora fragariae]
MDALTSAGVSNAGAAALAGLFEVVETVGSLVVVVCFVSGARISGVSSSLTVDLSRWREDALALGLDAFEMLHLLGGAIVVADSKAGVNNLSFVVVSKCSVAVVVDEDAPVVAESLELLLPVPATVSGAVEGVRVVGVSSFGVGLDEQPSAVKEETLALFRDRIEVVGDVVVDTLAGLVTGERKAGVSRSLDEKQCWLKTTRQSPVMVLLVLAGLSVRFRTGLNSLNSFGVMSLRSSGLTTSLVVDVEHTHLAINKCNHNTVAGLSA